MEAPNKIYLQTCGDCPGFECENCKFQDLAEVTWSEDKIFEKDIEYIRKDALLEWLKDGLAHLENGGLASEIGAMTLQEVIDKLNSM